MMRQACLALADEEDWLAGRSRRIGWLAYSTWRRSNVIGCQTYGVEADRRVNLRWLVV